MGSMSDTTDFAGLIARELDHAVRLVDEGSIRALADKIERAERIFLAGAGRSGLMGRAFAMRLMHTGISAYVVGETTTPGITGRDLLIVGSGSGETASLVSMAKKAKSTGASVAAVTINPDSSLGALSDLIIKLPGAVKDRSAKTGTETAAGTIQPMGSLYEQTLLVFYDAVILQLMKLKGLDTAGMYGNHANLE